MQWEGVLNIGMLVVSLTLRGGKDDITNCQTRQSRKKNNKNDIGSREAILAIPLIEDMEGVSACDFLASKAN